MRKLTFIASIFALTGLHSLYAQNVNNLLKVAYTFYEDNDFKPAIRLYTKTLAVDLNNVNVSYTLAKCYRGPEMRSEALQHIEKAYCLLEPQFEPDIRLILAEVQHYAMKFWDAIASFRKFLSKNTYADKPTRQLVEKQIEECGNGNRLAKEPVKDSKLKKAGPGTKIALRNIFFDTGKSSPRAESHTELENLQKLLIDNPGIETEVSGHTDNIGPAKLNKEISEELAKAVVEYLLGQGTEKKGLFMMVMAMKCQLRSVSMVQVDKPRGGLKLRFLKNSFHVTFIICCHV